MLSDKEKETIKECKLFGVPLPRWLYKKLIKTLQEALDESTTV